MDRAELEARAERALRRGELSDALTLYEKLATAHPEDVRLGERLFQLRQTFQPAELGKTVPAPGVDRGDVQPLTPEQEGERLFSIGDFAGAAAAYRRALEGRPENELIRERLEELYRLAVSAPPHSPTDATLPADREAILQALLHRISSRRRIGRRSVSPS